MGSPWPAGRELGLAHLWVPLCTGPTQQKAFHKILLGEGEREVSLPVKAEMEVFSGIVGP